MWQKQKEANKTWKLCAGMFSFILLHCLLSFSVYAPITAFQKCMFILQISLTFELREPICRTPEM